MWLVGVPSGWNLWVWLECIGVISGCCCKEAYIIIYIIIYMSINRHVYYTYMYTCIYKGTDLDS